MHTAVELIELLRKGSNKSISKASYLGRDQPLALRAIQAHSVIEAEPTLLAWRRNHTHEAPRLHHSPRRCKISSILDHGLLQGNVTDSARNGICLSVASTPVTAKRYRAEVYFRDVRGDVDLDRSDNDKPTILEAYQFENEVVVVEIQVACSGGCKFFASESNAILFKSRRLRHDGQWRTP